MPKGGIRGHIMQNFTPQMCVHRESKEELRALFPDESHANALDILIECYKENNE